MPHTRFSSTDLSIQSAPIVGRGYTRSLLPFLGLLVLWQAGAWSAVTATKCVPDSDGNSGNATFVTISGTNFAAGMTVWFGSQQATGVTITASTWLTCTAPSLTANSNTVVPVMVGGAATLPYGFAYGNPAVTAVNPAVGTVAAGSGNGTNGPYITISGTNFAAGPVVKFGTLAALNVTVQNANTITCTIGGQAATGQFYSVSVQTASASTLTNGFAYISSSAGPGPWYVDSNNGVYPGLGSGGSSSYGSQTNPFNTISDALPFCADGSIVLVANGQGYTERVYMGASNGVALIGGFVGCSNYTTGGATFSTNRNPLPSGATTLNDCGYGMNMATGPAVIIGGSINTYPVVIDGFHIVGNANTPPITRGIYYAYNSGGAGVTNSITVTATNVTYSAVSIWNSEITGFNVVNTTGGNFGGAGVAFNAQNKKMAFDIENNYIHDNSTSAGANNDSGIGMTFSSGNANTSTIINNNRFINNINSSASSTAGNGGALAFCPASSSGQISGTITITNNLFNNNGGAGIYDGGAVFVAPLGTDNATITIANNTFTNNRAAYAAGAIYFSYNAGGTVTGLYTGTLKIANNIFYSNTAATLGSAEEILLNGTSTTHANIAFTSSGNIYANNAGPATCYFGPSWNINGSMSFNNELFVNNNSGQAGVGGLELVGNSGTVGSVATLNITNCTFANNGNGTSATYQGFDAASSQYYTANFYNCIFYDTGTGNYSEFFTITGIGSSINLYNCWCKETYAQAGVNYNGAGSSDPKFVYEAYGLSSAAVTTAFDPTLGGTAIGVQPATTWAQAAGSRAELFRLQSTGGHFIGPNTLDFGNSTTYNSTVYTDVDSPCLGHGAVWNLPNNSGLANPQLGYDGNTPFASRPAGAPVITSQPVNRLTAEGSPAFFTATATSSGGGSINYQWQYSANGGTTWANVMTGTNQSGTVSSGTPIQYTTAPTVVSNSGTVFCVAVSNTAGAATSDPALLTVNAPTITVTPPALADGMLNVAYPAGQVFTASGGVAAYSFTLSAGYLPAGMTLSSAGTVSGTPTAAGKATFYVQATDQGGFTGVGGPFSLAIDAPAIGIAWGAGTTNGITPKNAGDTTPLSWPVGTVSAGAVFRTDGASGSNTSQVQFYVENTGNTYENFTVTCGAAQNWTLDAFGTKTPERFCMGVNTNYASSDYSQGDLSAGPVQVANGIPANGAPAQFCLYFKAPVATSYGGIQQTITLTVTATQH